MTSPQSTLLDRVEGVLLAPALTAADAVARAGAWTGLGVRRLLAPPWLLDRLAAEGFDATLAGAVAYPSGGSTLTSKRVELLECVRLGATAATVVLTPGVVASADAAAVERETSALLATAPELEVRFLVDTGAIPDDALTVLLRVLKGTRPTHLVAARGVQAEPRGPGRLRWLRDRLVKKVGLAALEPFATPAAARAALDAGADLLCTDRPEALAEVAP